MEKAEYICFYSLMWGVDTMPNTLGISRVSTQNRVVIPQKVAEMLGIVPGEFVKFVVNDDGRCRIVKVLP